MLDQVAEYPNPTAAVQVVAKRNRVGAGSVHRSFLRPQITAGQRHGASSEDLAGIRNLKAKACRLDEDDDVLRRVSIFRAGELDPRYQ